MHFRFKKIFSFFAILWFFGFGSFFLYIHSFPIPTTPPPCEAMVVFTGRYDRITPGFKLFMESDAKALLISGVDEGVTVKDLLPLEGIEKAPITLDYRALNTRMNGKETAKWVKEQGYHSLCLITTQYHMPRSLLQTRHFLKNVEIVPCPLTPAFMWYKNPSAFLFLLAEYHKWVLALIVKCL